MYCLIIWSKTKDITVIDTGLVIGELKEGATVAVKYDGRKFSGTVLRISEDEEYLNNLHVTTTGKIIHTMQKHHSEEALATKNNLMSQARLSVDAKKKASKERTNELLAKMDNKSCLTANSQKKRKQEETASSQGKAMVKGTTPFSVKKSDARQGETLHTGGEEPFVRHSPVRDETGCHMPLSPDCDMPVHNSPDLRATETPSEHSESRQAGRLFEPHESGSIYRPPTASAENIRYLESLVAFVRYHHDRDLLKTPGTSQFNEEICDSGCKLQQDITESATMQELTPGSGVLINRRILSDIVLQFKKNPKEMVRRIIKNLISEEELATMSACGEGKFRAVPLKVKQAVEEFVARNKSKRAEPLTSAGFIRTINLMCGTIRHRRKGKLSASGMVAEGKGAKESELRISAATRQTSPTLVRGDSPGNRTTKTSGVWTVTPTKTKIGEREDQSARRASGQSVRKVLALGDDPSTPIHHFEHQPSTSTFCPPSAAVDPINHTYQQTGSFTPPCPNPYYHESPSHFYEPSAQYQAPQDPYQNQYWRQNQSYQAVPAPYPNQPNSAPMSFHQPPPTSHHFTSSEPIPNPTFQQQSRDSQQMDTSSGAQPVPSASSPRTYVTM